MKRLVIRLEDALHRRLRIMSIETDESLQRLTVRLLQTEVDRHDAKKPKRERR